MKKLYEVNIPYYVMATSQEEAENMPVDLKQVIQWKRHAKEICGIWKEWTDSTPLNSDSGKTVWEEHLHKENNL